ncbi:MAG: CHAT domain-containing tetratricopeptide repeat protein [Planctomycetota bacterium]
MLTQIWWLVLLVASTLAPPASPLLSPDTTITGAIADTDPAVHSAVLDSETYTSLGMPARGKTYVVRVPKSGVFRIELRSYLFDAYLVLRNSDGEILAEDDNSYGASHARLVYEFNQDMHYQLEACALRGDTGSFELALTAGKPPELSAKERAEAQLADALREVEVRAQLLGADSVRVAESLERLGRVYFDRGDYDAASAPTERALAILERSLGAEHLSVARVLNRIGRLFEVQGKYAEGESSYRRALAIREKQLGAEHRDVAASLNNLGVVLRALGKLKEASPLFERVLRIDEKTLGPEHPTVAMSVINLASILDWQGRFADAQPLYERALAIYEQQLGPHHRQVAIALNYLAGVLAAQGQYDQAQPHFERALAILEKAEGSAKMDFARILVNAGSLFTSQGKYAKAQPLLQQALQTLESSLGPEHPDVGTSASYLAGVLQEQGKYDEARALFERALAISEKSLGPEHRNVAVNLNNLARVLKEQGDYETAGPIYERALQVVQKAVGPDHPLVAVNLSNLGLLRQSQGQYADARSLLERALAIREKVFGPDHPAVATLLNNLALLLRTQEKYAEARPLDQRAFAIREKALGSEHPLVAASLSNLAYLAEVQGQYEQARPLYQRALAIREKALGTDHPDVAMSLNNLALLLKRQQKYDEARPLFERALAIREKASGVNHVTLATYATNLASLLIAQGKHRSALPWLERSLQIDTDSLGAEHPEVLVDLSNLTKLDLDLGRPDALARARSLIARQQRRMFLQLANSSESDALRYAARQKTSVELLLSALPKADAGALAEGYEAILSWKGQVSRLFGQSKRRLFAALSSEEQSTLRRLRSVQAGLSNALAQDGAQDIEEHTKNLKWLRKERDALGLKLQRSGAAKLHQKPVRITELCQAMPADSVWIDFLEHRRFEPAQWKDGKLVAQRRWTEPQLTAWIVQPSGALTQVSLGASAPIREAAAAFLEGTTRHRGLALEQDAESPLAAANESLRALLWEPLTKHVAAAEQVFVCADAFLATLPFEILQDADEKFLIEKFAFVYLRDGAALQELVAAAKPVAPTLLAAGAIDYDERGDTRSDDSEENDLPIGGGIDLASNRAGDFEYGWLPLSETRREVDGIHRFHRKQFKDLARVLIQDEEATEERLKAELPKHTVIHLATHGYFQPTQLSGTLERAKAQATEAQYTSNSVSQLEHRLVTGYLPSLLSGLVCAGANAPRYANRDNGLLTAEEVSWLDLGQCDLVVLSACQTALGSTRAGEGMMSLRRAFHQAGARTVISSLWKVRDDSTRKLMLDFYDRHWNQALGKIDSLRGAQLEMLQQNRKRYGQPLPATWGAFVLSGEWR